MNKGFEKGFSRTAAVALLVLLSAASTLAGEVHHFANGITARVFTPAEINQHWTTIEKGAAYLTHPAAGSVALLDNSEVMHPFATDEVVAALAAMDGFRTKVEVDVFILPATPAEVGSSFARRGAIYLAPGTGPVDRSTLAYITTHEMGHVLTWAFLDKYADRWASYLDIRGLDASSLTRDLPHADRPREILAEDIRALFGGPLATVAGSIENHQLAHPGQVDGLRELLVEFFRGGPVVQLPLTSQAFPNPCNPRTSIEMAIPSGQTVDGRGGVLQVFDIRGSLVKTVTGGQMANNSLVIQWDGTGRAGEVVSSGQYLFVIRIGQHVSKGSVTLVR